MVEGAHPDRERARGGAKSRRVRSAPASEPARDFQTLLFEAVKRLRASSRATRVVAWALRDDGSPYVCAADYAGAAPLTPDLDDYAAVSALNTAGRLDTTRLGEIGERHGLTAAVRLADEAGETAAIVLVGPEPPRPRTLAALADTARRLTGPLAAAAAGERLARLDAEARRLDRLASLGTLTAEIAHEIRNPLVSIKTFLQLLPERRDDPEFAEQFLALATDELRRMERLLDVVLEHARPGNEPDTPGDVAAALESVLALLHHRAQKRRVLLSSAIEDGLPPVALESDGLRQVLLNLAINAIEATPPRSAVSIRTRALDAGVEIVVEDEGPGVAEDRRQHVFESFHTSKPGGVGGLGLPISRRIVTEAGGTIELGNRAGGGARFRITLPGVS